MVKKEPALGRGLSALLPEMGVSLDSEEQDQQRIRDVELSQITPNPSQPRQHFDETALQEMAQSIQTHGVMQPLLLTPAADGAGFLLVAGERR